MCRIEDISVLWLFDNVLLPRLGLADVLAFGAVSREHRRVLLESVLPALRVPLSALLDEAIIAGAALDVFGPLTPANVVLDCACTHRECWRLAAQANCPGLMRMLAREGVDGCDAAAMADAIEMDHGECVKVAWHQLSRLPGRRASRARAVECAARCGNLDALACMLRDAEGDADADSGEQRELCGAALDAAACMGNTHVLQWLVDSMGVACGAQTLRAAVDHDKPDSVRWLFENVPQTSLSWLQRKEQRRKARAWLGALSPSWPHDDSCCFGRSP